MFFFTFAAEESLLFKNTTIMAQVAGITVERSTRGNPTHMRIDLKKHADLIPLFIEKGLLKDEIKWTAKMKRALNETEFKRGDINNFWNE